MGDLIVGVNTLYMLSCFLKQFALVGKGLNSISSVMKWLSVNRQNWRWYIRVEKREKGANQV